MKHYKLILALAAPALLLASACNNEKGKDISEMKNLSSADSLSYYIGNYAAIQYWGNVKKDPSIAGDTALGEFRKGLKAAVALSDKAPGYVEGMLAGLNILVQAKAIKGEVDETVNPEVALTGAYYGLRSDTTVNLDSVQTAVRRLYTVMQVRKTERDKVEAQRLLEQEAKKEGMKKVTDMLYAKTLKDGDKNHKIGIDENATGDIQVYNPQGEALNLGLGKNFQVNLTMQPTFRNALTDMYAGGESEFLFPAMELFGPQCSAYGLKPTDICKMVIKLDDGTQAPVQDAEGVPAQ